MFRLIPTAMVIAFMPGQAVVNDFSQLSWLFCVNYTYKNVTVKDFFIMFNAAKIKELRKRYKINQKVMADLLGIERSTYTRREKNDLFYGDNLVQIANFFREYLPKEEYCEMIRKAFNAPEYKPKTESNLEEESMIGIQLAHILEKLGKLEAKLELYHLELESLKNLKRPAPHIREAGR